MDACYGTARNAKALVYRPLFLTCLWQLQSTDVGGGEVQGPFRVEEAMFIQLNRPFRRLQQASNVVGVSRVSLWRH